MPHQIPENCSLIYSNDEVTRAITQLSIKLNQQLRGEKPLVLCVMQGGLIFSGQLIPQLTCMLEIDYIHATRYNNKTSGGDDLQWKAYPAAPLKDRSILILDDILDEGKTLASIIDYCKAEGASSVNAAVLLRKAHDRCVDSACLEQTVTDNIALTVQDKYVFGYGMDYNGKYRQLDAIYALHHES